MICTPGLQCLAAPDGKYSKLGLFYLLWCEFVCVYNPAVQSRYPLFARRRRPGAVKPSKNECASKCSFHCPIVCTVLREQNGENCFNHRRYCDHFLPRLLVGPLARTTPIFEHCWARLQTCSSFKNEHVVQWLHPAHLWGCPSQKLDAYTRYGTVLKTFSVVIFYFLMMHTVRQVKTIPAGWWKLVKM